MSLCLTLSASIKSFNSLTILSSKARYLGVSQQKFLFGPCKKIFDHVAHSTLYFPNVNPLLLSHWFVDYLKFVIRATDILVCFFCFVF